MSQLLIPEPHRCTSPYISNVSNALWLSVPQVGCHGSRNRSSQAGSLFEWCVCDGGVNVGCHTSSSPSSGDEQTGRRPHLPPWDALIYDWGCWAISICHNSDILESRACGTSGVDSRGCCSGHQGTFAKQKSREFQRTAGAAPWAHFPHIWGHFCHVSIW